MNIRSVRGIHNKFVYILILFEKAISIIQIPEITVLGTMKNKSDIFLMIKNHSFLSYSFD